MIHKETMGGDDDGDEKGDVDLSRLQYPYLFFECLRCVLVIVIKFDVGVLVGLQPGASLIHIITINPT